MAKLQPNPMTLHFRLTGSTQAGYIDLSQCASLVSRKFFRQGLQWAVAGMDIYTGSGVTGRILVEKIPDTWITANAWVKGFKTWQKMNREALAETESVAPKFLDFKVYADAAHYALGVGENLLPQTSALVGSGGITNPDTGEWDMSKFVIPRADSTGSNTADMIHNREIIFIGANYPTTPSGRLGSVSLVEGYAASRALPDILDPNVPDDMYDAMGDTPENWLAAIFNDGTQQTDAVLTDMVENNKAPYPFENDGTYTDTKYPGGANQFPNLWLHDMVDVTTTTVGAHSTIRGGTFNCGLIKIYKETSGLADGDTTMTDVLVHLVPGKHRGYLAQPMQEVN